MTIQKIYHEYKEVVYKYLCSLCKNQSLAEDLTSEVFLSAIKSILRFRGECSIKTWLFSIARHKWYEHIRSEKKQLDLNECLIDYWLEKNHNIGIEQQLYKTELVQKIKDLVALEPERTQKIFWKRIEGYSFYEIAKELDITENSACVTSHRHTKKLKQQLEQEGFTYE